MWFQGGTCSSLVPLLELCLLTPQWSVGCPLSSSYVDTHRAFRGVWSFCKSIANEWYGEVYRSVILSSQIRLGSFLRVPVGSVGWSRNVWRYIISSSIFLNLILNPSKATLPNPFHRGARGWGTLGQQNHAAGRENGFIVVGIFSVSCVFS